jgi:23S rRNA (guanine745-N1)-methyltransferase
VVVLICSVRNCGKALVREGEEFRCAAGHSFAVARSGYVNLLQPQDKKSKHPGDSREAVAARRRLLEAGLGAALVEALGPEMAGGALLDVGCGEGFFLDALAPTEGWGLDLSTPAIDAAAKRYPRCRFVVGNADRYLPFADQSFSTLTSITSRRNAAEFARVLAPEGRVIVAVPGEDDQKELREAVLGQATARTRPIDLDGFETVGRKEARASMLLAPAALADLLAITYRGQRRSARSTVEHLAEMKVTLHWTVAILQRAKSR